MKKKNIKLYNKKVEKIEKIGEGVYGKVYKVRLLDEPTETFYALKQFPTKTREGIDITALREITILREICHENIVKIEETFYGMTCLFVAYEFLDCELSKFMYTLNPEESIIKGLMYQFLNGLDCLKQYGVLHRDIKPQNILLKKDGTLKIADFGFARFICTPGRKMTQGVISDWYRPPEIFFGATYYSYSADIWSAGCILGEMLLGSPMFRGDGEINILTKIFSLLGVPNETVWPNYTQLENVKMFTPADVVTIRKKFPRLSQEGVDLLEKMLQLDPNKRISASEAMNHDYFKVDPKPATKEEIAELIKKFKSE